MSLSKSEALKLLFYNLKDGDCIGFLAKGWKKYPIEIATDGACTHVCTAWGMERRGDVMSLLISEQSFHGGRLREIEIRRRIVGKEEVFYTSDSYVNDQEKIYYGKLNTPLTNEQIKIGIEDAEEQDGKKYGYLTLILGLEFLEKILPARLKKLLFKARLRMTRVCSSHVAIQYIKMGVLTKDDKVDFKDFFYTPIEVLNFDFLTFVNRE
jgi:hypothetical protein